MKKKLKITAGFLTVIVCVLLGCEKRERERTELFLEETEAGDAFSGQGEAGESTPGPGSSEEDTSAKEAGQRFEYKLLIRGEYSKAGAGGRTNASDAFRA